ncbi:MAG: diguanylate cyclase [Polyangiales bacterium]
MSVHHNLPAIALAIALGGIAAIGGYGMLTLRAEAETTAWVEHTYLVIQQLDRVTLTISAAESAARGYALTRDDLLFSEVDPAIGAARDAFQQVRELTTDNPEQQARIARLGPKLERRIALLEEYLNRVSAGGSTQVLPESMQVSLELRHGATDLGQREQSLLNERVAERARRTDRMVQVSSFGLAVSVLLLVGAFTLVQREIRGRRRVEKALKTRHADSEAMLRLAELLQACRNLDDAFDVFARFAPRLFDERPGAMFLLNPEQNWLEARSHWCSYALPPDRAQFVPDDCWALRRGQPHSFEPGSVRVMCKHIHEPAPASSLCLPLLGHGELLGVLHVTGEAELESDFYKRAAMVGEQVSMALANLALRDKLRNESIRDPLTGLFNRRYTEETLEREISRTARSQESLAVMMLDVDHFKRFNDTFGHEAGDQVLREIGKLLRTVTRGGDVVSRMGGEELLVILPSARAADAERKAEEVRAEIAKLRLVLSGKDLGEVTISIGVALFPQHGITSEELLRSADAALYAAKRGGRDRVVMAA